MANESRMEAFLLGLSFSTLQLVQKHLIQGNHGEALSTINESLRQLKDEIASHFSAPAQRQEMPVDEVPHDAT